MVFDLYVSYRFDFAMGFLIYFSILLVLVINQCHSEESNTFFDSYLLNKYENTKTILTKNFHEHYRKQRDVETTVSLHNVQEFYLNSISFSFEMDNATYILIEHQIYTLQLIDNQFVIKPHSVLPKVESEIFLIKSIDYEDGTLLLLVFTSGFSNVYIRRKSDWIFMQRVRNIDIVLDAQLFYHYNTLYLFLLNRMGSASVPSTLYKWTGMHFDEIDNVLTTGATSITCFEYMNSVIITITQTPSDYTKAGTIVMKFKNGKVRKLQFLNTKAADKVLTYVLNGERYIIILCTLSNIGTVYKWNGNYFMIWIHFQIQMDFKKVSINYYVDNRPVLYSINKDSATMYDIQYNYIELISKVPLQNQYGQILDIHSFTFNQNKYIYVSGVTEDYYASMIFISYSLHTNKIENPIHSESIVQCYSTLNDRLKLRVKLLTKLKYKSDRLLQVDKAIRFNNTLKMKIVTLQNSTVVTEYSNKFYEQNAKPIQQHLKTLKNKMANIKQHFNVLTSDVIIEGNMYAEYVKASSIRTATLNENAWNPNSWLLLSNDQTIQSEVRAPYIRSKHVRVSHENSLLKQLLLIEGNQIINNFNTINSLKSNNLRIKNINNIFAENLYRRSTLTAIKGKKYINRISTLKVLSTIMNKIEVHEILHLIKAPVVFQNYFIQQIHLTNLNFEEIHGISWNKYTNDFVKKNHVNTITGDLLINSNLTVNNLITRTITGIDVENLFTISTNQTISSDMQLMNINVNNIISNNINGLSFKKYAVVLQENNHITGPVSIKNVFVQKDIVGYNISKSNSDSDKNRFVQIYDNYLKITGNLHITNITDVPKFFYQNKLTDFNFANDYWLKNVEQAITSDVVFNELSVLHLSSQYLNNKPLVDYLMNNYKNNHYQFKLKNIFIPGNIILNLNYSQSTFNTGKLKENCVRKSGSYKISGYKIFSNSLEIDNLQAHILDNTIFDQVIQKGNSYKFADKTFSNIIFEENINLPRKYKLETKKINGFAVTDLMKRTAFINEASFSTNWNLKQITANNVVFQSTNKGDIDTLTRNVMTLFGSEFLKTLSIDDITLDKVYKTIQCNDINVVEYLSNIAWTNDVVFIKDVIDFTGNLYIENFNPVTVNSIYLKNLTEQYLFRNKIQTIHATFDFDTVQSPFLKTTSVNNIKIENLIRFRDEDIHIYTDLFLMTLNSISVTTKYFNNNINQFKDISKISLNRFWRNVTVLNDIYLLNQNGNINYIMNNVLYTQNSKHVITENVHFNLISVTNAKIVDSKINGINIQEMVSDALLRKHANQLVVGFNTFRKIYSAGASVYKNANIKVINNINIRDLNASLVNKNVQNTILGSKQFNAGIQIKNLQAASTVHNFDPKYLVSTSNTKENLLNVHFEQIQIMNDLDAININDKQIIEMLQGIVVKKSNFTQYINGKINFKDVSFIDTAEILSLNNIHINDVVVDDGVQTITGHKQFVASPDILCNIKVSLLNGYNVTQEFENSLLLQNDARLKNSVTFKNSPNIYNNINTVKINNINVKQAIEPLNRNVYKTKIKSTIEVIKQLDAVLVRYSQKLSGDQEFLNIMPAKHIQIPRHDSIGSHQYQINNNTILNVLHERQNDNCTQRVFSVYDHASLPLYLTSETDNHRIFSFNENNWNINVITDSTNTNATCRQEGEQAYIMWVSPSSIRPFVVNISESSHINEVYSFVLHNKAFVIITKLYETNVVTQVTKLAADKNKFNIVQNLTVELGSKIQLFQIAQDYILVIGKRHELKKSQNEDTEIYIFNEHNERFLLLQKMPSSGTVSSTSLSLDEEQHYVMLAEQNFKIQILNYNAYESKFSLSQNMYSDSKILEVNTLELKGMNSNEVSLTVVMDSNQFFICSFQYIEGWKCVANGYIDGLHSLKTFLLNGQKYVFAHSKSKSDILFISIQGIN